MVGVWVGVLLRVVGLVGWWGEGLGGGLVGWVVVIVVRVGAEGCVEGHLILLALIYVGCERFEWAINVWMSIESWGAGMKTLLYNRYLTSQTFPFILGTNTKLAIRMTA